MNHISTFFERLPIFQRVTPAIWQTGYLFAVDMVTNVTDYAFHLYLGWTLTPADFAVVQTMNSLFLILVTAFAVLQPVVARFVAEAGVDDDGAGRQRAIFQLYFRQSIVIGVLLWGLAFLARQNIAIWLNVPEMVVTLASFMVFLALARPVVAGMLQGLQRFIAFGLTRATFAFARFAAALALIGALGGGAIAGVAAMPIGGLLALGIGLALLGRGVWQRGEKVSRQLILEGWRLSLAALLAYTAFISLQNNDLIWVNRNFEADEAGVYAAVVVLRRILAVLPGAVIIVLYPRIITRVRLGLLPDNLLFKTASVIVLVDAAITALYFLLGPFIVGLTFGQEYESAAGLLGWMGVAMIGFGLAAIWLNLYLATTPWPFVLLLVATLLGQIVLFATQAISLEETTAVFLSSGWILVLGGLALYLAWLRPKLVMANKLMETTIDL